MFGAVPRTAWGRRYEADHLNRCVLAMQIGLVRVEDRILLIDTGVGTKHLERLSRSYYAFHQLTEPTVTLTRLGIRPDDVTDVILTHLHFDHCGGTTRMDDLGRIVATYPRARVHVSRAQLDACAAIDAGHGVLVAAPTGSGKTVVGEYACHAALAEGRRCFYTTPIKALSNQKYHDLVARHGAGSVGLLTGDVSVDGDAPLVVMTTEVLRNMLYADSRSLDALGYVVLDEVHYLSDRFRGAVWEEVILGLAPSVQIVSLSATVSNAEEFGQWLDTVRGHVDVIVWEQRPVPLQQHVMAGREIHDLFDGDQRVNPRLVQLAREEARQMRDDSRRPRGRSGRGNARGRRDRSRIRTGRRGFAGFDLGPQSGLRKRGAGSGESPPGR